jgi:hypothetical protein
MCAYCGDPAVGHDHIVPYAYAGRVPTESRNGGSDSGTTAPACAECNSLLGHRLILTVEGRRAYIARQLRKRYRKLITTPDWDPEEVSELGVTLRSSILTTLAEKAKALSRIQFAERTSE